MASQQLQHAGRLRLVGQNHDGTGTGFVRIPTEAPPAPLPAPAPAARTETGFAEALHTAIEASGLSLERIRTSLAKEGVRVSITTLSYWRRGRSQPERATSLRAVHLLEALLGLPHTSLSARLGPPRPRGRWVTPAACDGLRVQDVWPGEQEIPDVFAELDAPPISELERLSIHDSYFVDARRRGHLLRMRQVVRATVSGVSRCLVVHKADDEATGCPEITSVRHARLGRVRRRPESGLLVAELLLDRPLAAGDSAVFEYEVQIPPGEPTSTYARRFAVPVREYVLQVHFDPGTVPVHCESFDRAPGEEADRKREQLWIGASASAHVLAPDQTPGQVGIRWEWE
ncbi:hypothetical protein GCM10009760_11370 [Kitasatospora kazusensis]|uniref:XRE family transcriptional regulator n=1 Tax=Kitasatospora kazusensis TaxID=407974 RepID=A0ABP5KM76_9ACTN